MINGSDELAQIAKESALESIAEKFPEQQVAAELRRLYDLTGELTRIPTEKDDTFHLATASGQYLVKIAPTTESAQLVNLQCAVMLHLESSSQAIPAQRLIRGTHGQVESAVVDPRGNVRILRVLSFLEGVLLAKAKPTSAQFASVGAMLARLDSALTDFRHLDESRLLIWDLKNFLHLRPLLELVTDRDDVTMATWIFDQFEAVVAPRFHALETQMIHGDFSPFNVVVDPISKEFVTGIIDFGDVVRSPLIFELAVAVANQIGVDEQRPWSSALHIVRGYRSVRPLADRDIMLLAIAAPARLLLRALVFGWRADVHPDSRNYGLSHSALDWARLRCALSVATPTVEALLAKTGATTSPAEKD
ncbi:Homoserine kinase [Mycolicibacterium vanbaalenii]|uniref:Hydroxylysine kinase n=1 Tax=Mycolicibacterium vanbaalenii TaxID=110539 RepID=A0A5S9R593_MYCVN|nr:phosphotransferase [Mycolicibacterium vanbaalenii]CAA0128481.1 Homoserine kinase [Mycolicibacterium vanbaalenii]